MSRNRILRLNSLLKEVLSDVIRKDVKNPNLNPLFTVTRVDLAGDLRHAKVYISVIGDKAEGMRTLHALRTASGFIAVTASKRVKMHHFPELHFIYDDSVEKQMRLEDLISKVSEERKSREGNGETEGAEETSHDPS